MALRFAIAVPECGTRHVLAFRSAIAEDAAMRRGPSGSGDAETCARIAARFDGRWQQGYVRGKLRHDPAFAAVSASLHDAAAALPVLDLGCGMGLLGQWLREHGHRGDYLGVDHDPRKVSAGRAAARGLEPPLELRVGDLTELLPWRGHVVLLDVLHYLDCDDQRTLLAAAADRLAGEGLLLIRSVLRDASWRYRVTQIEERLLVLAGWMRTPARHVPTQAELENVLADAGLSLATRPLWGHTPFNSWLLIARRASAPGDQRS